MSWPDTSAYIGITAVICGTIYGLVQHFIPTTKLLDVEKTVIELKTNYEKSQAQIAKLGEHFTTQESKLEVTEVNLTNLEKNLSQVDTTLTKGMDMLQNDVSDLRQNVREDMLSLSKKIDDNQLSLTKKIDENQSQLVKLLLERAKGN